MTNNRFWTVLFWLNALLAFAAVGAGATLAAIVHGLTCGLAWYALRILVEGKDDDNGGPHAHP